MEILKSLFRAIRLIPVLAVAAGVGAGRIEAQNQAPTKELEASLTAGCLHDIRPGISTPWLLLGINNIRETFGPDQLMSVYLSRTALDPEESTDFLLTHRISTARPQLTQRMIGTTSGQVDIFNLARLSNWRNSFTLNPDDKITAIITVEPPGSENNLPNATNTVAHLEAKLNCSPTI